MNSCVTCNFFHSQYDGRGVVGHGVEKSPWTKAGKIERYDDVSYRSPPNLEISLIAEIAGMAGTGWINQGVAPKSINPGGKSIRF